MKKATKTEVQTVIKKLRDKEAVKQLLHDFYLDCVMSTSVKAIQTYGEDEGFDIALDFVGSLLSKDMIEPHEFLDITIQLAVGDFDEKEGE